MVKDNISEIGFEKQIWAAADELRGSMDASEYKHIVLGLIFLKYLSDKFEERYQELVDEGEDFEEEKDAYIMKNVFFVPPKARWGEIAKNAHNENNGVIIDEAMRAIEKENKSLKNILPKTFSKPELDKKKLGAVIDLFTNVQMANHGDKKDILGRTYEYCLGMFAETEGKKAGEFYTPACVVKTLVSVLQPYNGRVYDPCCGSGGMFVQSKNFIENHSGNIKNISIYGQESNPTTWKMAKMNLAIRGLEADLGEHNADTFANDLHPTMRADYIMANPPFNLKKWGQENLQDDVRWKYGIPPKGNANFAWMQHMIHHLAPNGRIGLVLANGSLSSTTSGEGKIRQAIVEDDLVECIVALPTQLFYTTGIPVCLWFLNKNKKQKGKTLFIDAREMGTMVSRKLRELTDEDINLIAETYNKFVDGSLEDEKGFCKVSELVEIEKHDFILTPGRYVGFKPEEDDGIPFEEKMKTLTTELGKLFKESNELETKIRKSLKEIGYNSKYTKEKTKEIIEKSLKQVLTRDKILLEDNTDERAITHKLACYLDKEFVDLDVDCEYNRDKEDIKKIKHSNCEKLDRVRPDIIVHERLTNRNHLVIEAKKNARENDLKRDICKLKWFIKEYHYEYALFINFKTEPVDYELIWNFDSKFNSI